MRPVCEVLGCCSTSCCTPSAERICYPSTYPSKASGAGIHRGRAVPAFRWAGGSWSGRPANLHDHGVEQAARSAPGEPVALCRVTVLDWLLDSDPAVRRQVLRDLTDEAPEVVARERARVATQGWGAQLLAVRWPDGQWAGGACFPADFDGDFSQGQPWTSTLGCLRPVPALKELPCPVFW